MSISKLGRVYKSARDADIESVMRHALAVAVLAALAGGCATTGGVPQPFPTPGGTAPSTGRTDPGVGSADGYAISSTALALRGAPYRHGGADPAGFDCSGLVQYVFGRHGLAVPRETRQQFEMGTPVRDTRIEPGDLVFFSTVAPGASHVGIAIGGDQFVHAPSSNGVVRIERLGSSYWARRFVGARRLQ